MNECVAAILVGCIIGVVFGIIYLVAKAFEKEERFLSLDLDYQELEHKYKLVSSLLKDYEEKDFKLNKMMEIAQTWGYDLKKSEKVFEKMFGEEK